MKKFVPAEPFHPGEYIEDELNARGWTHEDLASVTGISRRQLINLIQGKSGITPDTAIALAEAFSQEPVVWMNLQTSYELAGAAQKEREVKRRAVLYNKVPVREIIRRGWIPETNQIEELENNICQLLDIKKIEDKPNLQIAARKATPYETETGAQLAWYGRARQLAQGAPATKYSLDNINTGISELLKLAAYPEDTRRVPQIIANMGIRLVFIKHLQHTRIDGVAFWLDDTTPAIALSLRYNRIDNFWFTLFHEIIHIKYHDYSPIDTDTLTIQKETNLPAIEIRANHEAANYLIPEDKLISFIHRKKPHYYEFEIAKFAQTHGIHPGIVIGQLQNHPESGFEYKQLRRYLVHVRDELLGNAITDGCWQKK
jgi:HTH-type transcriptional regulator/antitoxin HigA